MYISFDYNQATSQVKQNTSLTFDAMQKNMLQYNEEMLQWLVIAVKSAAIT